MKKTLSLLSILILLVSLVFSCKQDTVDMSAFWEFYNGKLAMFEEENLQYADQIVDAVFLGDSLTDGYDVKSYYPEYTVLNRGIGGDTTIWLEQRLDVSLYAVQTKVAIMLIGANNMDSMFDHYEGILKSFKEKVPNTKIILLSLTSMSREWGKKNQLAAYNNVKIKKLAEQYGFEFVDLYSALLNLETGEIYDEYTTDGGHLTPKGYQVVTSCIKPVLQQQIDIWEAEKQETL